MPWAVDDAQKLRHGKGEVNELGNEEQHQCLGEVTKDSDHGKSHTSTIAESITDEHFRWELITLQESKGTQQEWDDNR